MFGGARQGDYDIVIRHKDYGLLETTNLALKVESTITSVSPQVASVYGGTLLRIEGTNFGTKATDNPVQISYNGGMGSIPCIHESASETEIVCRLADGIHTGYRAPQILKSSKKGMVMNPHAVNCSDV